MPLQNRVTPFGEIVAVAERGTMMGNRGILHDASGRLRRRWAGRLWICCLLQFRGRREPVMAPGRYTRLFFLDEPTALAAGHRPCAFCRRDAYRAFRDAWAAANAAHGLGSTPRAAEIDRVLHAERVGPGGAKRLHRAELSTLPDGTFVVSGVASDTTLRVAQDAMLDTTLTLAPGQDGDASGGSPAITTDQGQSAVRPETIAPDPAVSALLRWRGSLWRWSPGGYQLAGPIVQGPVLTLTPPSIVGALASGYQPGPPAGLE